MLSYYGNDARVDAIFIESIIAHWSTLSTSLKSYIVLYPVHNITRELATWQGIP